MHTFQDYVTLLQSMANKSASMTAKPTCTTSEHKGQKQSHTNAGIGTIGEGKGTDGPRLHRSSDVGVGVSTVDEKATPGLGVGEAKGTQSVQRNRGSGVGVWDDEYGYMHPSRVKKIRGEQDEGDHEAYMSGMYACVYIDALVCM
jgi:hypothetical protein